MLLLKEEFAEKTVKKYIDKELWLDCTLADYYIYLEYYDEGGYGLVYKVMDRISGEHLILKKSSKKDFVPSSFTSKLTSTQQNRSFRPPEQERPTRSGARHNPPEHEGEEVGQSPQSTKYDLTINKKLFTHLSSLKVSKEAEFMVKIYNELGGIKLYDYYDDDDYYILVMEYGGRSLEKTVCCHKKKIIDLLRYESYRSNFFYKLYLTQIIKYMIKTYHKIKKIYDIGIHHNDLKPENILINGDNIDIIDFGVAKRVKPYYEKYKGTLEYVPYEYVMYGSYKPWDHTIWCFGIMLHFLSLMKYPFLREEDVIDYKLDCQKINKLPPSFSAFIYDCLNKDPIKRPSDLLNRIQTLQSY